MFIKRIAAFIIDYAVVLMIGCFLAVIINGVIFAISKNTAMMPTLIIALSLIYTMLFCRDIVNGQSLGKSLFKIKVVDASTNEMPNLANIILRNVTIFVWFIDFVILIFNSKQRLGDFMANTKVVEVQERNTFSPRAFFRYTQIMVICFIVFTLLFTIILKYGISTDDPLMQALYPQL